VRTTTPTLAHADSASAGLAVVRPDRQGDSDLGAFLERLRAERSLLAQALLANGGILFRGFEVGNSEQFGEAVATLSDRDRLLDYRGGASPRRSLSDGRQPVYNSTEYPPDMELSLHNELSYSDAYPDRVYFFCLTEPQSGGETTWGDSRRILQALPHDLREEFERKGVRYVRNLPSGKGSGYSWQDVFACDDKGEVERYCSETGVTFQWLEGDLLRLTQTRPATAVHPETGDPVWFNQADGFHPSALDPATHAEMLAICGCEENFRLNVSYGDGTPIEASALSAIRQVIRKETRAHVWQAGDILLFDNLLTAHGRRPFVGPRRIAVAMS
jgi:alpha-ketoglutarate-dependent taurine dioxygenase